jgi:UDP-glucose 4-epimerase
MLSRRVIVLGARGFVARSFVHLVQAQGQLCVPVGSREVDLTDSNAHARLAAIFKPDDAVVVCSALTPEKGRDLATFRKNVCMVDQLCTALESARCAQVVYISSDSVYGPRAGCRASITEDSCCETDDFYGLSHVVREKMVRAVCAALGIRLAILRLSAIYGADDTHNAYGPNRFIRTALAARRIALFGEGEETRDHIYIRDVVRIIQLAIERGVANTLNVAAGIPLTFREIACAINQALGDTVTIESAPRQVPVIHRSLDITALLSAFPEFRPTPFDIAIRETIFALRSFSVLSVEHSNI